ncbi:hypothetical protein FRC00_005887, partial [Tulasnella sp. 408]
MTSSSATTPVLQYTPLNDIPKIREHLKATFSSGRLRSVRYRRQQLLGLVHLIEDNSARFEEAFKLDLGRHNLETTAADLDGTVTELMYLYDNFGAWTKPEKPPFNLKFWALSPVIRRVPKGVVLVIGPFNGAAIATGNACVVKMSELTPNVAAVVTELLPKYLDQDFFRVVNGGILETTAILELQWDHIVFTGSPAIGKVVAAAAAKHLTPTTLELGGQCPVFCDQKMDMYLTAKRLLWSKAFNAGQTCTTVNHIFVPFAAQDALVAAFVRAYNEFYPEGAEKAPISSLVTDVAFKRVKGLLEKTKGEVVRGGQFDEKRRFIAPTILKNVALDDIVMESELFGPILPIVPVKSIQDAIDWTNSRPHPLAVYAFTNDSKFKKYIFNNTQSGQFVVNDTSIQGAIQTLPFGGVGESGYGMVKGKYIIDTLSHLRATCESPRFVDSMMGWRFPPYTIRNSPNPILSEFPLLLSGKLKLSVPVYTIWGACEDVSVLEKLRAGEYDIENLHVIDEATSRTLEIGGIKLRLLGLGGAYVPHKLFDNGDGHATIAGGQGTMWTTALQMGELVDTAQKTYDQTETRMFVSHASPGREGLLAQLGTTLKADLTISAALHFRYASSWNEFSVQQDAEAYRAKLDKGKNAFDEVWRTVKSQVEPAVDEQQKILLEKALSLTIKPVSTTAPAAEEAQWKNTWNWNLCDAAFGYLVLDIREGRVSAELKSQGFNYAYRRAAAATTNNATAASTPASALNRLPSTAASPAPQGSPVVPLAAALAPPTANGVTLDSAGPSPAQTPAPPAEPAPTNGINGTNTENLTSPKQTHRKKLSNTERRDRKDRANTAGSEAERSSSKPTSPVPPSASPVPKFQQTHSAKNSKGTPKSNASPALSADPTLPESE